MKKNTLHFFGRGILNLVCIMIGINCFSQTNAQDGWIYPQSSFLVWDISQASNGELLVCYRHNGNPFLQRITTNGNQIWSKNYYEIGESGSIYIKARELSNKDILIIGTVMDQQNVNLNDVQVLRLDSTGALLWRYSFQAQLDDVPVDFREFSDGSLAILSRAQTMRIMLLSPNGQLLWRKAFYASTGSLYPASIDLTSNNEIVVGGQNYGAQMDWFYMRISSSGYVTEHKTYNLNLYQASCISSVGDSSGGLVMGFESKNSITANSTAVIVRMDSAGNVVNSNRISSFDADVKPQRLVRLPNGDIGLSANDYNKIDYRKRVALFVLDPVNLTIKSSRIIGKSWLHYINSTLFALNDGMSLTTLPNVSENSIFFTNQNGEPACHWININYQQAPVQVFSVNNITQQNGNYIISPHQHNSSVLLTEIQLYGNACLVNSIENNPMQSGFVLYPNPASDFILISNENKTPAQINLIDINGKTLLTQTIEGQSAQLNLKGIAPGAYIVRISTNENYPITQRIIITDQ